jgi:hypothetical protein
MRLIGCDGDHARFVYACICDSVFFAVVPNINRDFHMADWAHHLRHRTDVHQHLRRFGLAVERTTSRPLQLADVSQTATMSTDAYAAPPGIRFIQYESSKEAEYVSKIRQLISKDLSEPYSIYVYRYFLYQWGDLCFMVSLFP